MELKRIRLPVPKNGYAKRCLKKKNVEVPTEMKFEVGVVIITFQMACQLDYRKINDHSLVPFV